MWNMTTARSVVLDSSFSSKTVNFGFLSSCVSRAIYGKLNSLMYFFFIKFRNSKKIFIDAEADEWKLLTQTTPVTCKIAKLILKE